MISTQLFDMITTKGGMIHGKSAVKTLQQLLNAKGYSCGTADGSFGAKTEAAVKKFQKAKSLTVDGSCGKNTWTALLTK